MGANTLTGFVRGEIAKELVFENDAAVEADLGKSLADLLDGVKWHIN